MDTMNTEKYNRIVEYVEDKKRLFGARESDRSKAIMEVLDAIEHIVKDEDATYRITKAEMADLAKSKTFAVLRKDLQEEEDLQPATSGGYTRIDWSLPHRIIQPDRLDDEEFNMFVYVPKDMQNTCGLVLAVSSIDFEFLHYSRR